MEHLVAQAVTVKGGVCMYCSDPSTQLFLTHFYKVFWTEERVRERTKQYIRRLPSCLSARDQKHDVDDNHFES